MAEPLLAGHTISNAGETESKSKGWKKGGNHPGETIDATYSDSK